MVNIKDSDGLGLYGVLSYADLDYSILEPRFHPPENIQLGHYYRKGRDIRFAVIPAEGKEQGTLFLIPGNQEPLEKYFEYLNETRFDKLGIKVVTYDLFGLAGSGRYPDIVDHAYLSDVMDDVNDLAEIIEEESVEDKPIVLMGHSRGAHTMIRYLQSYNHDHITAACAVAPMQATQGMPKHYAPFIYTMGNFFPLIPVWGIEFDPSKLTSDSIRGGVIQIWADIGAYHQTRGLSYGFTHKAYHSMFISNREENIHKLNDLPIFFMTAKDDIVVDNRATGRMHHMLGRNSRQMIFSDANHDIWMEKDSVRTPFVEENKKFVLKHIIGS